MLDHEANPRKFSTSWTKSFLIQFVNIPLIVIKPVASFKGDFVPKVFFVAQFFMVGKLSYLNCSNQ